MTVVITLVSIVTCIVGGAIIYDGYDLMQGRKRCLKAYQKR